MAATASYSSNHTPAWLANHLSSLPPSLPPASSPSPLAALFSYLRSPGNRLDGDEANVEHLRKALLTPGIDSRPNPSSSLLHATAEFGCWPVTLLLLDAPYAHDVSAINGDGENILMHALKYNQMKYIVDAVHHLFITSPATVRSLLFSSERFDGHSLLHQAAARGLDSLVEFIMKYKDSNTCNQCVDRQGRSPLFSAVQCGHLPCVDLLSRRGFSLSARDGRGWNILHVAAECGRDEIFTQLTQIKPPFDLWLARRLLLSPAYDQLTPPAVAANGRYLAITRVCDKILNQQLYFYWLVGRLFMWQRGIGYYVLMWLCLWIFHHIYYMAPFMSQTDLSPHYTNAMYALISVSIVSWLTCHSANPGFIAVDRSAHSDGDDEYFTAIESSLAAFNTRSPQSPACPASDSCSSSSSSSPYTPSVCVPCGRCRPFRSKHCRYCDSCVELFDHHCLFMGNCIGLNNYRSFLLFIYSTFLVAAMFAFLNLFFMYKQLFPLYPFTLILSQAHLFPLTVFIAFVCVQQQRGVRVGLTLNEAINTRKPKYAAYTGKIKSLHYIGDAPWRMVRGSRWLSVYETIQHVYFFMFASPSAKRVAIQRQADSIEGRGSGGGESRERAEGGREEDEDLEGQNNQRQRLLE